MPNGIVVYREQVPVSGTWQVRAPLNGATPLFVLAACSPVTHVADDSPQPDSGLLIGGSSGASGVTYCNGHVSTDGLATSQVGGFESIFALLRAQDAGLTTDTLRIDIPTFVPNGLDVTVTTATIRPMVEFIFFYSDEWEAYSGINEGPDETPVVIPTGFTGSNNDNQIFFFITSKNTNPSEGVTNDSMYPCFGVATRNGAAGAPAAVQTILVTNRDSRSSGFIRVIGLVDSVGGITNLTGALSGSYTVSDISDNQIAVVRNGAGARSGFLALGLNLKDDQAWAGVLDSLTANGSWIVNDPGFQPQIVGLHPSQMLTADGTRYQDDCEIAGMAVADANTESSVMYSFEANAAAMVAKTITDDQFLNVLQDDGSEGWKSGANDFSLTATGWRVDNVVVDGGGGGAPLTTRKWLAWAIEGEAGPPGPEVLDIDDLRHARRVDQVDVIEVITLIPIDIDGLRHARAVDAVLIGVSYDLFVAGLRHGRALDPVALDVSVSLVIDGLSHGRRVDVVDVQALVGIVLDVSDQRHGRPVDSLLLDVEQPILVNGLRHGRPVDAVGVQPLLGDQTGIGASASTWILDAGQPLNNATSVDFDYHVLEGIFDSDQSVLGVDGARVTGSAGMRELTALTVGANVDGQERVQGEIAEIRIYAGALSQADRDRIVQELTAKWITG